MTSELRNCPHCGAEDSLETFLRIDLDDVVVDPESMEVTSFILAGSANDPYNGLVTEEARVLCRECGRELEGAGVPVSFTSRWVYYPNNARMEQAQKLCHMLNRGVDVLDALASLGIEPEDVSSEHENLALDDPDNDVVDLHYDEHGLCVYMQRHAGRWHVHTVRKETD